MAPVNRRPDELDDSPVYVISVVAQITGLHAQTLRQYDRVGLVSPQRTPGGGRRYSRHDIDRLRRIQVLSQEGIGLAGIKLILDLQAEVVRLADLAGSLEAELDAVRRAVGDAAVRDARGGNALLPVLRPRTTEITVWNPALFR